MSGASTKEEDTSFCASCGTAGGDGIKLKDCDDCDLVRYCSVKCKEDHLPNHEEECKKRAAELKDEILFRQPESSYLGDCPICCSPLPIDPAKSNMYSCCCKYICVGCKYANVKREYEGRLRQKCPFCRKAMPKTQEKYNKQVMKRVEANDPVAIGQVGAIKYQEGDYEAALEYATKAATFGDAAAHYQLSNMYGEGIGVEKDEERELYHLKEAAIAGHSHSRHNLGWAEEQRGRMDRAAKHFIIAAKLGDDDSLESVKNLYKAGHVSKDDFAAALRGHHSAIVAMKTPLREVATKAYARLAAIIEGGDI